MKKFEAPEVQVTELNVEDVITTSNTFNTCPENVTTPDDDL